MHGTTRRSLAWPGRGGSSRGRRPAVDVNLIDLTDRKGALEKMGRRMRAEHRMEYRREMNRRRLAGSGLA